MKTITTLFISMLAIIFAGCSNQDQPSEDSKQTYAIAIHGGAGNTNPDSMSDAHRSEYKAKLQEALTKGVTLLEQGKPAEEVIEQVIHVLENSPLFNAGKGAVFNHDGFHELDASIMLGKNLNAGAVSGVSDIKSPISAAIAVMKNSEHVLLSGKGASKFAREQGLEIVDSGYFSTPSRYESLQRALKAEKHGTVGCVVLDSHGNLAAGTSTGGMTNKKYGRIGDSPIIGAGTYANNTTCAVSATGHGEYFIRYTVAHEISALMQYKGLSLKDAANELIMNRLKDAQGDGGVIAVDKYGNVAMPFNTNMMFRAYAKSNGDKFVAIFKEQEK
jgi:beta-aspartyl-peptidase (threonine type)